MRYGVVYLLNKALEHKHSIWYEKPMLFNLIMRQKNGIVRKSLAELSEETGLGLRMTNKAIELLIAKGLIERESHRGRGNKNIYRILIGQGENEAEHDEA